MTWRIQEMMDQPARVEIAYRDPMLDYQAAMAFAEHLDGRAQRTLQFPARSIVARQITRGRMAASASCFTANRCF